MKFFITEESGAIVGDICPNPVPFIPLADSGERVFWNEPRKTKQAAMSRRGLMAAVSAVQAALSGGFLVAADVPVGDIVLDGSSSGAVDADEELDDDFMADDVVDADPLLEELNAMALETECTFQS